MNCYHHPETTALGICKSCGRGLCSECVSEVADTLACTLRCEVQVKRINDILDQSVNALKVSKKQSSKRLISSIISGIAFALLGYWLGFGSWGMPGILFVFLGVASVFRAVGNVTDDAEFP